MRITFFSTMEGSPWGGSEELWCKTAMLALQQNHSVQVCIINTGNLHPKVVTLRASGASIVLRTNESNSIKNRLSRKAKQVLKMKEPYIDEIEIFKPDFILVSQGGTFDYFNYIKFYNYVNASNVVYALICHVNIETGGVQSADIKERIQKAKPWSVFYFVSERNKLIAERQYGNKLVNTKITDNPINIATIGKLEWPDHSKGLQIACVARFDCWFKGQDVLLEALSDPVFKPFHFNVHFYGAGSDKEHLEQLIKYYKLEDKVQIIGHVSDIDDIWKHHHVLILPSIAEGTPISLRECMLKGRPAIVTDVGGCSMLVEDGITGFLVPVSSSRYLKEGLLKLFNTPSSKLEEMGDKAFDRVISLIDLKCCDNILDMMVSRTQN